jgi:hypothetical protein
MDPSQVWMLVAFMSLMTAALILLELGMRRAEAKRLPADLSHGRFAEPADDRPVSPDP